VEARRFVLSYLATTLIGEEVVGKYVDVMKYIVMYNRLVNQFEWRANYERRYKGYVCRCGAPCKGSIDQLL
jgi:hypothetical protein